VFDEPFLWRAEAASALGLDGDDLVAALCPGASYPAALRSMLAAFPGAFDRLVDLGAGPGAASEWFRVRTGATVTAVEPSAGGRWVAQGLFPHLDVVEGTAEASTLADGVADVVTLCGVLSLVRDADAVLDEVERIATDEATLAIADLCSHDVRVVSGPNVFRRIDDIASLVMRRGWRVVEVGCGSPSVDPSWAATAARVDAWLEDRCAGRPGYTAMIADREHLSRHVESGALLAGTLVATRRGSG
jgi:precorrin-6B methylase 2